MLVLPQRRVTTRRRWFPRLRRPHHGSSAPTPGQRRLRIAIGAVMLATLIPGERGLYRLVGLLRGRAAIRSEISDLEARRRKLEADLRSVTSDPATIERLAREQLDLVRRGETVYKFPAGK